MAIYTLLLGISLGASVIGAVCGIGGGVIIKPLLDSFGLMPVATISFLSGCTVLAMSCFSVGKAMLAHEKQIEPKTATPLAIGSVVGGVVGKWLFSFLQKSMQSTETVGGVQAICLAVITLMTIVYTLYQKRVSTKNVQNASAIVLIGLLLGLMSSFLGIGGGPINLMVLSYFFSMSTKKAAQNSLYIILFSQLASLVSTLVSRSVPAFDPLALALMIAGGIGGAMIGRKLNKKLSEETVRYGFCAVMVGIVGICIYNVVRFMG